jgi:hypothetical protein
MTLLTREPHRYILSAAREEGWELERYEGNAGQGAKGSMPGPRRSPGQMSKTGGEAPASVLRQRNANELTVGCGPSLHG